MSSTDANAANAETAVDSETGDSGTDDRPAYVQEQLGALSLDEVFEVLKNQRRRHVLHYLKQHPDRQISLSDLAEHIAAKENDKDVARLTSSERKRVYVGLYQCHLPKMDDMNIVDFNQNRGLIKLGRNAPQLEVYLEPEDPAPERAWYSYYLALAFAGGFAFVLGVGISGVPLPAVLGLFVLTVGTTAMLHAIDERDGWPFAGGESD